MTLLLHICDPKIQICRILRETAASGMPCPYFEPQKVVENSHHPNARLPLLQEYDGLCHAGSEPVQAPAELRFDCCNRGYSKGSCARFPLAEARSSMRYSILRRTSATLELICIEEQNYAPLRWRSVQFFLESKRLEPELDDACITAQAIAFCRSYLGRFSSWLLPAGS